jgi:hypothetical protein
MTRPKNIRSYFMQRVGGRLYRIQNMGQHGYDVTVTLKGENTYITKPMRTFLASLAKLEPKTSSAFHAPV